MYDLIIIGGGPGGYTAALYAARAGMKVLVLEQLSAGGQMALTSRIENYPGFEDGIEGYALGEKMRLGAEQAGAATKLLKVLSVNLKGDVKEIQSSGGSFYGKCVVFAMGATPRKLMLEHEEQLAGRGVHYCATCDGMIYRGKTTAVVGGGNSAAEDALLLSGFCGKVTVIHRRDSLRAERVYQEMMERADNIEFCWDSEVVKLGMEKNRLAGIWIRNRKTGRERFLEVAGLFVSIGRNPASELVRNCMKLDENGYIPADETTRTEIPGVFAVGDVRTKAVRQIITAAADGAAAVHYAREYLSSGNK